MPVPVGRGAPYCQWPAPPPAGPEPAAGALGLPLAGRWRVACDVPESCRAGCLLNLKAAARARPVCTPGPGASSRAPGPSVPEDFGGGVTDPRDPGLLATGCALLVEAALAGPGPLRLAPPVAFKVN